MTMLAVAPLSLIWAIGLVCVLPAALVLAFVTKIPVVIWLLLWTAGAGIMFLSPVEDFYARAILGVRRPASNELRKLEPLVQRVCASAGVSHNSFTLWVQDTPEVNAFARAGRTMSVTSFGLEQSPDKLEAILAHELGHHLGGHAFIQGVMNWFSLPYLQAMRLRALGLQIRGSSDRLFLPIFVYNAMLLPLRLFHFVATVACRTIGRQQEMLADRTAARLGYGPALIDSFKERIEEETNQQKTSERSGRRSVLMYLISTHPPLQERIYALEQFLSAQGESA